MTASSPKSHRPEPHQDHEVPERKPRPGLAERRYSREFTQSDPVALISLLAGGLCTGASVYGTFITNPPVENRGALYFGALLGLGISLYRLARTQVFVRVGDAGVAIEQSGEITRLLWWEINSVRYESGALVLSGANTTLRIESRTHTRAIRAILKEAAERLPNILDVPAKLVDELPKLETADEPELEAVRSLQIAGKRCAVTKQVIAVERDARLCPNCTTVYQRSKMPERCVTCRRELGNHAVAP